LIFVFTMNFHYKVRSASFFSTFSCKRRKSIASFLSYAAFIAGASTTAHAQVFELPASVAVPSVGLTGGSGGGGGDSIDVARSGGVVSIARPVLPSSAFVSTSLEYETWNSETKGGFTRIGGNRLTGLFNYTTGGPDKTEVGISVPLQRVEVDGLGTGRGVGDIGLAFRKYFYDDANPNSLTVIVSLRGQLPTGNEDRGLGLGRLSVGPSLTLAKPFGKSTLLYTGGGFNYVSGQSLGLDLDSSNFAFIGGVTRIGQRLGIQYDAAYFTTPFDEKYTRVLFGPQFYLTPTQAVQVNFRKELKAAGKPFGVSLGYSSNF
jgi:hypothetical protein